MQENKSSKVRIVSFNGYYHMYKEIDGQHWVGMVDHRIGNLTNQITAEQASKLEDEGAECYSQETIDSFARATVEQLKMNENV